MLTNEKNNRNNQQKQIESQIVKKVLCSKCGIGVYVRQDMIEIEENSQYFPKHPFDLSYETFLKKTRNSKDNETIITKMIRLKLPSEENEAENEGKEFILYDMKESRRDGLGNKKHYVRMNLGKYPIPEKIMQMGYDEDYQPVAKVVGIGEVNTGYEIPFSKEKDEEMHKLCKDKITATNNKKTEYIRKKKWGR